MKRCVVWVLFVWCIAAQSAAMERSHRIVVDLDVGGADPRLYVLDHEHVIRASYPIAGPRRTPACLVRRDVHGTVTAVDHRARWYPTQKTKESVLRRTGTRLKDMYGPDEPGNALGGRKINVLWQSACLQSTVRIHATNEPSFVQKQARVSRNCIRMTKEDWDDLARYVERGTQVIVTADWN